MDLHAFGVILTVARAVGLIISAVFLATRRPGRTRTIYEERHYTGPPS